MLPVIVVPFLTLVFWILGGGKGNGSARVAMSGLNMRLPNAMVDKDSARDKLAFYMVAEHDSSKRAEQLRIDPYRKDFVPEVRYQVNREVREAGEGRHVSRRYKNERPFVSQPLEDASNIPERKPVVKVADPELEAINGMLDKLTALQQPKSAHVAREGAVEVKSGEAGSDDYFGKRMVDHRGRFLDEATVANTGIVAVVPCAQVLQSGSIVKLELTTAVSVGGAVLAGGSLIYGVAALAGERLLINIVSVRVGDRILPVQLSVYDFDGMEGIYVPGSLARDVIKESADGAVQSTGIAGFDLSLKTQVAAAGIGAAKSLLSRKVKAVRVQVEAGYRVLLRDNQQKELR
ncbi:MAG: conjugative transposon protein TraM [Chitinophagaceae bacterium]|nr:conjugative transposon protein TraM [Chitinophagaceae bacterium]